MIKLTEAEKRFFDQEGYLVKKGLFTKEETRDIKSELERIWIEQIVNNEIRLDEIKTMDQLFPRLGNAHRFSDKLFQLILDHRTMGMVEELVGEDVLAIQTVCYYKAPGGKGVQLHQDNYEIGAEPGTTYAAWISLDDTNEQNGGLFVVPATQNSDIIVPTEKRMENFLFDLYIPVPDGKKVVPVNTSAGDVVFFGGQLLHGSYRNQTMNQFRRAFVTHYVPQSVDRLTMYHNKLINKQGETERRRVNLNTKFLEQKRK